MADPLSLNPDEARNQVATIYGSRYGSLCCYARALGAGSADAEDAVQDVFAAILSLAGRSRAPEMDDAYVLRAVRNRLAKQGDRRRVRRNWADQMRGIPPAAAPSPDRGFEARQRTEALARAINALPPRCRGVFLLVRCDGLKRADAARRLGVEVGTVDDHLRRADRLLKELLPGWGAEG